MSKRKPRKPLPSLPQPPAFANIEFVQQGQFMVAEHAKTQQKDGCERLPYVLHGLQYPSMFKTARNAIATAAHRSTPFYVERGFQPSIVFRFEPAMLPIVTPDDIFKYPGLADRVTELEFAERQIDAWSTYAARLRAKDIAT